jgi:hypothetical protein
VAAKAYHHPELFIPNRFRAPASLPAREAVQANRDLARLGVPADRAFLDLRGGRWGTLLPSLPLIPGNGVGNRLTWSDLDQTAPEGSSTLERAAWQALREFLRDRADPLRIDVGELEGPNRVAVHGNGELIQIFAPRVFRGVPVQGSFLTAVISHGNLTLLGTRNWGDIRVSHRPGVSKTAARVALEEYLEPLAISGYRRGSKLALIPGVPSEASSQPIGHGYRHRLAWLLYPEFSGQPQVWEAMVDAHSGELLAFRDVTRYATARKVVGGVYPAANDGVPPGGVEQAGFPMPYADVTQGLDQTFSDGAGNLSMCVENEITTSLTGRYVEIVELCGSISESNSGDLDLGTSGGTNCVVPQGASPGNTHSARTGFYELNRALETARGQLPGNGWLESRLTAIMNFPVDLLGCNAFWDGSTVTFFAGDPTFPPTGCSNTGELPGVMVHELAHGVDQNDANGIFSSPGEGIADVLTALRLNDSCIGRGFFMGTPCDPGDGDPCSDTCEGEGCQICDGVRDIDWAKRSSGDSPHDLIFIDTFCPFPFGESGPCAGAVHCEGAVVSEAAWDLLHRDLRAAPFSLDFNTALEITTRLFYLGSGAVGSWFQCEPGTSIPPDTPPGDGCNADGGYLNLLAVDDDNGDLSDGTPHMEAIFAAFDRHGIACDVPVVQNSGCSGAPSSAPVVTTTALDRAVRLEWTPVAGASRYAVFRTEGVFGCEFGKVKVGETSGTEWLDQGLMNGFEYFYVVLPVGSSDSCLGPASSCSAVTPSPGANLAVDSGSVSLQFLDGDLDEVIDNCESANLSFDIHNIGTGPLTNVQVVGIEVLSHPTTVTVTSPLPILAAANLEECGIAQGAFQFRAEGLDFNDSVEFRVHVTADELAGLSRSTTLGLTAAESDVQSFSSKTFSFETDLEGWEVVRGTFDRTEGSGAVSSSFFFASSANLPDQCDEVRSPVLRLSPTSTLSLWNLFDIEEAFEELPPFVFWFDRANVGIVDVKTGQRTPVVPDGGRLYNAGGTDGSCVTINQEGWADSMPTWAESTWSAAALESAARAGEIVQLDVGYGTDAELEGFGFHFDEVTLTDIELVVGDVQSDVCAPGNNDPLAEDDLVTPDVVGPVTIAVLDNDEDPDPGDTLRLAAVGQPANGSATIDSVGPDLDTITYSPEGCFTGVDSFQYSVTDGNGGSAIALVTVDLTGLGGQVANDLNLEMQTVETTEVFQGCHSLSAGNDFAIISPGDVIFRAGDHVELRDDFWIGFDVLFTVEIVPELDPPPP